MRLFSFSKHSLCVLIHIDGESINGCFVRFSTKMPPEMFPSVRIPLRDSDMPIERILEEAIKTLTERLIKESSASLLRIHGKASPDAIFVSPSSPWQRTVVGEHTIRYGKPITIEKKHLALAAKEAQNAPRTTENTQKDFKVMDQSLIGTKINGYFVTRPVGKRARELSVYVLEECTSSTLVDSINRALRYAFHQDNIFWNVLPSTIYKSMRVLFPHEKEYMFIEVEESATTITVVREGIIRHVEYVDEGIAEGDSGPLLHRNCEGWTTKVCTTLDRLAHIASLPQTVFIATDPACVADYVTALREVDLHQVRLGDKPLTVIPISPTLFQEHTIMYGEGIRDIFLSFMALHAQKKALESFS